MGVNVRETKPDTRIATPMVTAKDWYGPGRHAKLLTAQMAERANDGLEYKEGPAPFVGKKMKSAEA